MKWLTDFKRTLRARRLAKKTPKDVFRAYYSGNKWGSTESKSGKGSTLAATQQLRPILSALLQELEIKSVLDVPCGDFNWMKHVDLTGIRYLGGDIVEDLIAENTRRYSATNVRFETIDLIHGALERTDLILVRDCLVHLSHDHVFRALENIRRSGSKWLLTTTFPGISTNSDIVTGQWRKIDLTKAPFCLPLPHQLILEGKAETKGQNADKALGLWLIADLPPFNPNPVPT